MYSPIDDIQSEAKGWLHLAFYGSGKCAANLAMAMGLRCTTDFKEANHPNYHFPFPFVKDLRLPAVAIILALQPKRCLVIQATKPRKPQKYPNSSFHHSRGTNTYERILTRPEVIHKLQRETYGLARPSVLTCIVFFRPTRHWACPCAIFLQYREAHYPFRFSSDGELTT